MHDVVVDAAKAVAQIFTGLTSQCSSQSLVATSATTSLTISPACLADVRMKQYEQLLSYFMMASWIRKNF